MTMAGRLCLPGDIVSYDEAAARVWKSCCCDGDTAMTSLQQQYQHPALPRPSAAVMCNAPPPLSWSDDSVSRPTRRTCHHCKASCRRKNVERHRARVIHVIISTLDILPRQSVTFEILVIIIYIFIHQIT